MELPQSTATIERSEVFVEKKYSIGNEKLIMKLLRTKMYSNPIKVLIQEYLCNARDANREAGSSKAIEVHIPTPFNESFEIRDYGIGISPDRIDNVFVKYGASTKRLDNTQTGGFGLGAKSAWAYSDSFSITTISEENGVKTKRFYSAIIDEADDGSLMKIAPDEVVDEPTGTRIIIPVKKKDFDLFVNYTLQTVFFWKEEVVLVGRPFTGVKYDPSVATYKGNGWILHPKSLVIGSGEYSHNNTCLAVVDGIQYVIKPDAVSECSEMKNNTLLKDIFYNKFLLFFNTGELNIAANREELYYDDKTKSAIVAKLKQIEKQFIEVVEAKFNTETSYFNLVNLWNDLISLNFTFSNREENFLTNFKWQGKDTKIVTSINSTGCMDVREYCSYRGRRISRHLSSIPISKYAHIYENDEGKHLSDRRKIKTLINKHGATPFFVIGFGNVVLTDKDIRKNNKDYTMYTPESFKQEVAQIRETFNLDLFNFNKISTIEKAYDVVAGASYTGTVSTGKREKLYRTKKVNVIDGSGRVNINPVSINIHEQVGYYIPTIGSKNMIFDGEVIRQDHGKIYHLLSYFGKTLEVFYIPEKTVNRAKSHKKGFKMVPFWELVYDEIKKNKNVIEEMYEDEHLRSTNNFIQLSSKLPAFKVTQDYNRIIDTDVKAVIEAIRGVPKIYKIKELLNRVDPSKVCVVREKSYPRVDDFTEAAFNIMNKYPLLFLIERKYDNSVVDPLINYMNAIHAQQKNKACLSAAT
jgi:hypothetical protein